MGNKLSSKKNFKLKTFKIDGVKTALYINRNKVNNSLYIGIESMIPCSPSAKFDVPDNFKVNYYDIKLTPYLIDNPTFTEVLVDQIELTPSSTAQNPIENKIMIGIDFVRYNIDDIFGDSDENFREKLPKRLTKSSLNSDVLMIAAARGVELKALINYIRQNYPQYTDMHVFCASDFEYKNLVSS